MISATKSTERSTRRRANALKKRLIRDFVSDVEELLDNIIDVPDDDLETLRDKVAGAIVGTREAVESSAVALRKRTRAGASAADEFFQENPWLALGVAFSLGVALGFSPPHRRGVRAG